jgi:hypothetical protein
MDWAGVMDGWCIESKLIMDGDLMQSGRGPILRRNVSGLGFGALAAFLIG